MSCKRLQFLRIILYAQCGWHADGVEICEEIEICMSKERKE